MFPNVVPPGFPVIICATLKSGRKPGYMTGFKCKVCQKELQVSPHGMMLIRKRGGWTFCQHCGIPLFSRLQEIAGNITGVGFTPDVLATLAKNLDTMSKEENVKADDVEHWMNVFEKLIGSLK